MDNKLSENKLGNAKKNKKYHKYIVYFYKNLYCMINHVDFLFNKNFILKKCIYLMKLKIKF